MRLRPHGRLGQYELESVIGEGGLGDVWKAHDRSTGRLVALRILPTPPPGDSLRFARLDDEVRKLLSLRHPNIARVLDLVEDDSVRALAYEWVVGESLATRLARGSMPLDDTIRIIAQAANGLAAAHTRDLVHGNVKPSNITLCSDATVKVMDLGQVQVYECGDVEPLSDMRPAVSARFLGTITGTAAYKSPEQVGGHAADSRADVWAFGCVLFEMLTGKPAFAANDLTETMMHVAGTEPEWALIPPATPSSLVQMLRRCLDRDPLRRSQRMTDVLGPIRVTIGEEGATEAFMRQSSLRRMVHRSTRPEWTDESVHGALQTLLPALRRWARGLLPRATGLNFDALVEDVVSEVEEKIAVVRPRLEPDHAGLLHAYLRESILQRIRTELRRRRLSSLEQFVTTVHYGDALKELSERDQEIIRSRLEDDRGYEQIATLFSFRTADTARMAVVRALRRLLDRLSRKRT